MRAISVGLLLLLLLLFDIICLCLYLRHRSTRSHAPPRQATSRQMPALVPIRETYDTHPIDPEPVLPQQEGNGSGSALHAATPWSMAG